MGGGGVVVVKLFFKKGVYGLSIRGERVPNRQQHCRHSKERRKEKVQERDAIKRITN